VTAGQPEETESTESAEPTESSEAPAASDGPAAEPEVVPPTVEEQLAERTADLKRLQAEYINYKRRVERDRVLIKAQGEAGVLRSLLTVLDDLGRAAEHGELKAGFKAVADALQQAVKGHKLEAFGAKGDEFDPRLHEALFHAGESADVDTTTVDSVIRTGYRIGDDVLRHAQVSVIDPVDEKAAAEAAEEPAETPANDDDQD
jgi:molecular chaperone GrpE